MFTKLKIWKESMILVEEVYRQTGLFPGSEVYGLTSQLRRSAVSIPSNIAEGKGRKTDNEFKQFLYIARGSLFELRTQLEIARRLGYLEGDTRELKKRIQINESMLNSLITKL